MPGHPTHGISWPKGRLREDQRLQVRLRRLGWRLQRQLANCIVQDGPRWPLALPITYGIGISLYFSWLQEPHAVVAWVLVLACVALIGCFWRRHRLRAFLVCLAFVPLGHGIADLSTEWQLSPLLDRERGPIQIEGRVLGVETMADGRTRAVLEVLELEAPEPWPDRVRLRLLPDNQPPIGATISVLAVVQPPSGPLLPEGFDFRRNLAFQGIGAVGYAVSHETVILVPQTVSLAAGFERLREEIAQRVRNLDLPPAETAIIIALLTGERGAIPTNVLQDLRDASLAHLLAISGLHVGLVAGIVFFTVRGCLAAIPLFAIRWPLKQIAAIAATLAAIFYMLLVGAPVPTQRAVFMVGLVLLAVLFDRRAITLRLVALAALLVLTLRPVSLLGPSFQMSFAAVLALVVVWRGWSRPQNHFRETPSWAISAQSFSRH